MTSKEMESRSGVARANIRYYEAEGLLAPARGKNGYRDYSEADLAALERIKLLRRLGVSIEDLKALQAGTITLDAVLSRRGAALGGERAALERVAQVCGDLRTAGETFHTLNAGRYLEALDAPALPPEGGAVWWKSPSVPPLPETDALPVCTSIPRRLFARMLDEFGMSMLLLTLMALLGTNPALHKTGVNLLSGILLLFVEPLLIHLWGTTPGKALLGLRLTGPGGRKLTYAEGFTRHLLLLWYGVGLGIPIWNLVRLYQSARRCGEGEPQPWDVDVDYTAKPYRWKNTAAYLLTAVLVIAAAEAIGLWRQFPPNRGDLTVAEFAENFNRQADYFDLNFFGQRLDERGNWEDLPFSGTVYINISDWGTGNNLPFAYTVEDDRLTAVTLSASKENTADWLSIPSEQMAAAAMAFTWAQREAPFRPGARKELLERIGSPGLEGFTIRQGGTVLTLEIRQQGFHYSDSLGLLIPEKESGENFCGFTFTISLEE